MNKVPRCWDISEVRFLPAEPTARCPNGKGVVCKTNVRGFDSHPSIQIYMPSYANWQCGFSQKELVLGSNPREGTKQWAANVFEIVLRY